ncbi:MAG: hypothetical protein EOM22_19835, partial [Gammaproteobacteria bacterium]|nr:hypothetical protein [Gammaproteobacteria bacterium]
MNHERLFVVSVVVATLTGSLYVYLVDFYFAGAPDQAVAADPLVADRIAPVGQVTLAEPVVAAPAAETAFAATEAPAGESTPVEPSADGGIAEASASDAGSTDVDTASDASTELPPDLSTDQAEARAAVSADPIETLPGSSEAVGAVAAPSESS